MIKRTLQKWKVKPLLLGVAINSSLGCTRCRNFDIMDSMIQKLEKYADNLENIVHERTAQLVDEKQKTDMLLYRMLPPYAFIFLC